jgi:flagellar basal-body rod protein FlgC
MGISAPGMRAPQTRAVATANNVANIMTPHYDRLETKLTSMETRGVAASVVRSGQPTYGKAANVDLLSEITSLTESE